MRVLTVTPALPTSTEARTTVFISRQIESLRRLGVDVDLVEITGASRAKYAKAVRPVRERAARADLVHAHYGMCGWVARAQRRRPVVVSFLGSDLLSFSTLSTPARLRREAEVASSRILARLVDGVVVKSPEMAAAIPAVDARVIPNGVDLEAFRPEAAAAAKARLGWAPDALHVLFPADPERRRKRFPLAQAAVAEAARLLDRPLELVPLGGVPADEVPALMNACDAAILTSMVEGSPNVIKEAMACDLPVVSVRVGDVPQLLDGVAPSALAEPEPAALGAALAEIIRAGERSNGREALKRKGLDLESAAEKILALYEELLEV